jgi:mono/diheme cytochrome c family protein
MLRRVLVAAMATFALGLGALEGGEPEPIEKGHAETALPFLKKHCFECHGEKDPEGDTVLLGLGAASSIKERSKLWRLVLRQVERNRMPPGEEPQPAPDERQAFVAWTKAALGPEEPQASDPGRVTVRRLNRAEYDYTVRDLLGVRPRPRDEFPLDDSGYGFDRIGDVLSLPPLLLERYLAAAEQIASEAILDFQPQELRASASDLHVLDTHSGDRESFKVLYSNGRAEWKVRIPWSGDYLLRVRAYGDQAGPEPAKMAFEVDDETVETYDVKAVQARPEVYEKTVRLKAGERRISAAFLNDYWQPDDPDPKNRDRNLAVEWIELKGPKQRPKVPFAQAKWFQKRPDPDMKPDARRALEKELLAPLASRAWRRPASADELEKLANLVELALKEGDTWERGLQLALQSVLVSPSFIFRLELQATKGAQKGIEVLDQRALATRLSYFLWSSLPDDELMAAAEAGTLVQDLAKQTRRLLHDPKASRLTEQFAVQWLHLRRLDGFLPDGKTFPSFDEALRKAARTETEKLFDAVLRENRSVKDLIDPDFTFVNERLAKHYGIDGVEGKEFVRVAAPPERRGLLGNASVLMATSNPTRTSPVKRGRWVLEVLLDDPPPPPIPGTDSLKDEGQPIAAKSLHARLEVHRSKKECAVCHAKMDPIGFALERFDAIGALRDKDGEEPIDDEGSMPGGGEKIAGAAGLRAYLAQRTGKIALALSKKLLVFGLGRGPIAADDEALARAVERCAPDYKLEDMIVELVQLDAFKWRRADGAKTWH